MDDALTLPAKLNLSAVAELHGNLLARRGHDVVLDLSEVTYFGALCLQTMIAAARQTVAAGHDFSLRNTSDRVLAQLRVMGVTPETIMEGQP